MLPINVVNPIIDTLLLPLINHKRERRRNRLKVPLLMIEVGNFPFLYFAFGHQFTANNSPKPRDGAMFLADIIRSSNWRAVKKEATTLRKPDDLVKFGRTKSIAIPRLVDHVVH